MAFNPSILTPASKSAEFAKSDNVRSAKDTLLNGIDEQLKRYKDPKLDGKKWFTVGKTETAISLRYGNKALVLKDGETLVTVPNAQFEAAMAYYKEQVEKDAFKDQLAELEKGVKAKREKMLATRAANKGKPKTN